MTLDELEDLAYMGQPMPELRSQAEVLAFLSFRNLYDFARRVGMTAEQGKREKSQIVEAYRINRFLEDIQEDTNRMWKQIEIAVCAYRKQPSIENADKLIDAMYKTGCPQRTTGMDD